MTSIKEGVDIYVATSCIACTGRLAGAAVPLALTFNAHCTPGTRFLSLAARNQTLLPQRWM